MSLVDFSDRSFKWNSQEEISELIDQINKCGDLSGIDLSGNVLSLEAAEALGEALENKKKIKALNLSDLFTGQGMHVIQPALKCILRALKIANIRLEELNLSDNALGFQGIDALTDFFVSPCCNELKVLKLNNNGLGVLGAEALNKLINSWVDSLEEGSLKCTLTTLECGSNMIENVGMTTLSIALKRISSLHTLKFHRNGIRFDGIKALGDVFKNNKEIRHLSFNDNILVSKGASILSQTLPELSNLEHLDLGDCLIKDKGAQAIVQKLPYCKSFKVLDMSYNEITESVGMMILKEVAKLNGFTKLSLDGNLFGTNGLEKITEAYVNLKPNFYLSYEEADCSPDEEDETDSSSDAEDKKIENLLDLVNRNLTL